MTCKTGEKPAKKNRKARSVAEILKYRPNALPFTGKWLESFGTPELGGCWLIWGNSGNGKTRFTLQLCKYLAQFGRVAYNSLEEGLSLSFQTAIKSAGMQEVARRFVMLDKEPAAELRERLLARKSPEIVVVDSIQYSGLNKESAKALVDEFPRKLFIFVSHAEGKHPSGRTATAIRFHAGVKLHVEGYRIPAPVSRFKDGACAPFTIWEDGAARYWGGESND
jgi:hypothetical protein